ncbi:hypothetical protein [Endozoicomonas arenosclerae]|uniref:hypothetical protein n=1 Tax=Endozoicomonas arenosclerae TaxID=1633495 RepID=UPI000780825C|nr:hypothetical protein [Endozoicomonas arenosclerae]
MRKALGLLIVISVVIVFNYSSFKVEEQRCFSEVVTESGYSDESYWIIYETSHCPNQNKAKHYLLFKDKSANMGYKITLLSESSEDYKKRGSLDISFSWKNANKVVVKYPEWLDSTALHSPVSDLDLVKLQQDKQGDKQGHPNI